MPISRRLLTRLAAVLAAMLAVAAVSGVPAAWAQTFVLYNNTSYPNADLGAEFGLTNSAVVYDHWGLSCSDTGCSNVPDQDTYQTEVKGYVAQFKAGPTAPVTLDFENIVPVSATSAAQAAQEVALWKQLITWTHQAVPQAPVGMYSYDWETTNDSYTAQLYASGYFNYFAPSMYTRWSTMSTWQSKLSAAVSNDHSMNSALPIYPYLWPQSDYLSGNPFTSSTDWNTEVTSVEAQAQGAIIWSNTTPLDSSACGWLGETAYLNSVLQGDPSYGPLTVTPTVPNTCLLSRDATTTIPVQFTNNGTSTTSTATLQPVSGLQGITETYTATSIPALAPGASWSTTLQVTVPATETDTTALLHIHYTTGDRRLTVIIP